MKESQFQGPPGMRLDTTEDNSRLWKLIDTNWHCPDGDHQHQWGDSFHRWVPAPSSLDLRQRGRVGEVSGSWDRVAKAKSFLLPPVSPWICLCPSLGPSPHLWLRAGAGRYLMLPPPPHWNLSPPNLAQTSLCPPLSPCHPWILIWNNGTSNLINCVSLKITQLGGCVGGPCFHSITHPNALSDTFHLFFNSFTIRNDN